MCMHRCTGSRSTILPSSCNLIHTLATWLASRVCYLVHQQTLGGVENNQMIKLMAVRQFIALWERVEERTGCGPLSVVAVDSVYTRVLTHQHSFLSQHLHGGSKHSSHTVQTFLGIKIRKWDCFHTRRSGFDTGIATKESCSLYQN